MTTLAPAAEEDSPVATGDRAQRWSLGYQPGLDGLRAIGMTWMLLYHAEIEWARGAFLALSQFFTLSGFLVTTVLLRELDHGDGLDVRRFLVRRVRRLWPASLLTLAGIAVFGATVADGSQQEVLPRQVAAASVHVTNWLFIADDTSYVEQFAAPSPVQHFWSLSLEEQFYLLLPLLLLGAVRLRWSRRVLGAVVAGLAVVSTAWMVLLFSRGSGVDRVYYGTDTRMAEILMGVGLAIVLSRTGDIRRSAAWRWLGWVGAAAYGATLVMFVKVPITEPLAWRGGIVVFALASCAVVVGVLTGTGPLRVLSWGPLPAVGRLTYGLYLIHLPVYLWLTSERTGLDRWPLLALRLAVTFALATASFHLLEKPFRAGAFAGWRFRALLGPAVALVVVAATFATAGRGAADPWATLRGDDGPQPVPAPTDPVLDVLVLTDEVGAPLAARLGEVAERDESLDVVQGGSFTCDALVGASPDRTCARWQREWPALIERHDPDAVFLFVDDWPADDLQRLAGAGGDPLPDLAVEVVGNGLDLLTADGAKVLWGTNPEGILDGERGELPFHVAMTSLLQSRSDLRRTEYIAAVPAEPDEAYLAQTTEVVLDGIRAHRRGPTGDVPRVMVVGDSQAKSIGYGLERLVAEDGSASVWNLATPGCGIANDGEVRDLATDAVVRPDPSCAEAVEAWGDSVERFDPDLVLVLTSVRDVADRRLDGSDGFGAVGDDRIDDYLLARYVDAVDVLSAEGATVVWLKPPCVRYESPLGGGGEQPSAFDPERIDRLNGGILPALAEARPDDVVLYGLEEILCPGGEFLERTDRVGEVRPDGIHPSEEAALWLAELIQRDVVRRYG